MQATHASEDPIELLLDRMADSFQRPLRAPVMRLPSELGLDYEDVTFPSLDGVPLEGWFIPAKGSERLKKLARLLFLLLGWAGRVANVIHQSAQLRRQVSAIGEVQEESGEWHAEPLEHRHQLAALYVRLERFLHTAGESSPSDGHAYHHSHIVGRDPRIHGDVELTPVLCKFPAIWLGAWRRSPANAAVSR